MAVNPDIVDFCTRQKYENAPKNAKDQHSTVNQKNTKHPNVTKESPAFALGLPGGRLDPLPPPPVNYATSGKVPNSDVHTIQHFLVTKHLKIRPNFWNLV